MKQIDFKVEIAQESDLEEILSLQKRAYFSEAEIINDFSIQPLTQTICELKKEFRSSTILKAVDGVKIIGSVRAFERNDVCHIGKLIVDPSRQNNGIGKILLKEVEKRFNSCRKYSLFTSKESARNLYFYNKAGYSIIDEEIFNDKLTLVNLEKKNSKPLR